MSHASHEHKREAPRSVGVAILTVSDSRDAGTDASGDLLARLALDAGHRVAWRSLVRDDAPAIRAAATDALAAEDVALLLVTGGTGVAPRDVTPEALAPLLEKRLPGFGEAFRMLSFQAIGSAAMLSRAEAGIHGSRAVFLLPGSPDACRLAMEKLILPEAGHVVSLLRR